MKARALLPLSGDGCLSSHRSGGAPVAITEQTLCAPSRTRVYSKPKHRPFLWGRKIRGIWVFSASVNKGGREDGAHGPGRGQAGPGCPPGPVTSEVSGCSRASRPEPRFCRAPAPRTGTNN